MRAHKACCAPLLANAFAASRRTISYNPASKPIVMAAVDLTDLVDQRMEDMKEDDEGLSAEATFFMSESGPWGFIVVRDEMDELIGFEFVETEGSWRRPEAMLEYNAAADAELEVLVVVPDEAFAEVVGMVYRSGDPSITISDYSAMELITRPLVS